MNARRLAVKVFRRLLAPILPGSYRLPFAYWLARLNGDMEPELLHVNRLGANRGIAIDAGANEGLYSYRLSKLYDKVISFEPNSGLTGKLKAFAPPGGKITVHDVGLSDAKTDVTLYVPRFRGQLLYGWASLRPGNLADAESHLELPVAVRTLDSYELDGVTFLKADVEGHELQLLAGARETIRRNKPVVLIEVKDANRAAVASFFAELGYCEHRLKTLVGIVGSPENYIYLPGA